MAKKRPVMPPALVANDPPPPRLAPPAAVEVEAITQRAIAAAVEQRVSERIQDQRAVLRDCKSHVGAFRRKYEEQPDDGMEVLWRLLEYLEGQAEKAE